MKAVANAASLDQSGVGSVSLPEQFTADRDGAVLHWDAEQGRSEWASSPATP